MKIGYRVRLPGMPLSLKDNELKNKTILRLCLGRILPIKGFQKIEGFQKRFLRLDVGRVVGKRPYLETIWIEPKYVELLTPRTKRAKPK